MNDFSDFFMPVAIGIISFAIGISLEFKDFGRVFRKPKGILTGLVAQIIILPLLAFAIIFLWPIDPVYKAGFILIASCPGGSLSNFLTYILHGRVALSVSLTAFNSMIILFTIPVFVDLGMTVFMGEGQGVDLSFAQTFGNIFYTVIIPTLGGICFNELTSDKVSEKIEAYIRYVVIALLLGIVAVVLFSGSGASPAKLWENIHLMIPLFVLNIASMLTGFFLPGLKFLNLEHESRYTIAIEVGLQNSALAIYVGNEVVKNKEMAMMAVLYGGFSLFTSWLLAYVLKRFGKRWEGGQKKE